MPCWKSSAGAAWPLPLLQRRWNALTASVLLGLVWGLWHLPLMVATGEPPVGYLLLIVPQTVLMTWVVNSTRGSMLLAMLFHASLACALTTLYPGSGSMVEITLTWLRRSWCGTGRVTSPTAIACSSRREGPAWARCACGRRDDKRLAC